MKVDLNRLGKIGIDRIVIYNFKILNFNELEKEITNKKNEYLEKIEIKDKKYRMVFIKTTASTETKNNFTFLQFNPNKIKDGHNIYNSTIEEMENILNDIVEDLKKRGVMIDLTGAKIKEIELNKTINTNFEDLNEIILFIARSNYKRAILFERHTTSDKFSEMKKASCLYINNNTTKSENVGKTIKIYDKTFELLSNQKINISEKLARIEILLGREYLSYIMEKEGLTNDLKDFLNYKKIEDTFYKSLSNELIKKPFNLLNKIKKELNYHFLNFRRNENVKRKEREKRKKEGKSIPEHLKEERGVFEYLAEKFYIFDSSFLFEIVEKNINSKHKGDFKKQIIKKYAHIKNKEIYEKFIGEVFNRKIFFQDRLTEKNKISKAKKSDNLRKILPDCLVNNEKEKNVF